MLVWNDNQDTNFKFIWIPHRFCKTALKQSEKEGHFVIIFFPWLSYLLPLREKGEYFIVVFKEHNFV